jgi:Icc-related predicted phosphoesterase
MRLLLFSDLHCDLDAARHIVAQSAECDVLIGAGDFASVRRGLQRTVDVLQAASRPAVLVPGNNESPDELLEACRGWPAAHVLHGSGVQLGGISFFGLGGGVPVTPFGDWSFDLTEEEAAARLAGCPRHAVLVSHSPPKDAVDRSSTGQHLGSTAVRQAITQKEPLLVVCGHIHESAGQQAMVGRTTVINAGPAATPWELGDR